MTQPTSISYDINRGQLPYAKGPFSYEFVEERPVGEQWRIHDSKDDAVGSASTEDGAQQGVAYLNSLTWIDR